MWAGISEIDIVVKANGVVRPLETVSTISNISSGKIIELNFENGDVVKKGEVLFKINSQGLNIQQDGIQNQITEIETEIEYLELLKRSVEEKTNLFTINEFERDINNKIMEMGKVLKDKGALPNGPLISTTYAIDPNGKLDMEILLPIDREIVLENDFKLKKRFRLNNAIFIRHMGNPVDIGIAYEKLAEYITENNLQQITTGYNVNILNNINNNSIDKYVIDVYIGVSDNIL